MRAGGGVTVAGDRRHRQLPWPVDMIRTWSPRSCRSRPRWPRSGRCCPPRAPASTSTPGRAGPCPPRPAAAMDEQAQRELAVGRGPARLLPEDPGADGGGPRLPSPRSSSRTADASRSPTATSDGHQPAGRRAPLGRRRPRADHAPRASGRPRAAARVARAAGRSRSTSSTWATAGRRADHRAFAAALERPAAGASSPATCSGRRAPSCPSARLGERRGIAGAVMIADAAQAAGAIPVSVEELAVDRRDGHAAHKWLLGPEGMAALWVRRRLARLACPRARLVRCRRGVSIRSDRCCAPAPGGSRRRTTTDRRSSGFGAQPAAGSRCTVGLPWAHERASRLAAGAADRWRDPRPGSRS